MSNDLDKAIKLVQQRQDEEAQSILEGLIRNNPQDLVAWSWYVKSCRTPEKRLEALDVCLKFNPGNTQILDAIQKLQEKVVVEQQPAFHPPPEPINPEPNPEPNPEAYTYPAFAAETTHTQTTDTQSEDVSNPAAFTGLDESPGRPFIWYDVWFRALTQANVDSYTALLRDPLASPGRAYWWVLLAGLVSGLIFLANPNMIDLLNQVEHAQEGGQAAGLIVAVLMLGFVLLSALFSIPSLMIGAAIYDLIAKMFGGSGNFSRTVYLMGAYSAPFSILTSVLSIIPLISCLTIPLSFYGFWLGITTIQAAQRLNGGRSTIVILIPSLALLLVFCIVGVAAGSALIDLASAYSSYK